jgi:hypothetical protein
MGHYCKLCRRVRANEKFSGKGHSVHICKDCWNLSPSCKEAIEQEDEILGFLRQSRISTKNRERLAMLSEHADAQIRHLAELVLRVSMISEGKRKRWRKVRASDPALYQECLKQCLPDCTEDFEWDGEIPPH